ncbi:unnamed protein product [Symbiodinium natans]|uniref:Pentatricopeptide repeat-containing protein, chloroplastic n=1 Tax=Symbiodinium natans TaxID=878477 RepID=A0A812MHT1_9DINO|nr:unnamed protein product [Symbiodinium natans]
MAGKRLVMAPSPGTGLFAHEPRPREKGRYAREPPKETDKPLVDHEEERVNKQLVEILERKVAKLRGRADEEERGRKAAEAQLEDFKQRLEIREHEMAVLSAAKRDLEEDRHEAVRRRAELEGVQQDCWAPNISDEARRDVLRNSDLALRGRQPELLTAHLRRLSRKQVKRALQFLRSCRALQLEPNVFHLTAAVSACEKSSSWGAALGLISSLTSWEVCPNEVTLSSGTSACAKKARWQAAFNLLRAMRKLSLQRDEFSGSAAICASAPRGLWPLSLGTLSALHWAYILPSDRAFACCSAAITACEKGRRWQMAHLLLHFPASVSQDVITFSAVLSAFQKADRWEPALQLLGQMHWASVTPNAFSLNAALSSCAKGRWKLALVLPGSLPALPLDRVTYNTQIRICEEVQRWRQSFALLGQMRTRAMVPDLIGMSSAMAACERTGQWKLGLHCLSCMRVLRMQIDDLCWSCAMSACDSSGRWQAVLALMSEAQAHRCMGDAVAHGIAMRACSMGSLWQQALDMLSSGEEELAGDMICYSAAISACFSALVVRRHVTSYCAHEASEATLEELQQQQRELAFEQVEQGLPAQHGTAHDSNDGVVPDPELPPPQRKSWTDPLEFAKAVEQQASMHSMKSAIHKGVLTKMGSKVFPEEPSHGDPHQRQRFSCETIASVLCNIFLLPIGVVLCDAPCPWLQKAARRGAVLVGSMMWVACVHSASTDANTGREVGSCWLRACEATAFLALLFGKSCSKSFGQLNGHYTKAMKSQGLASSRGHRIKWDVAVILGCCACWLACHCAKVRLVSMSGGQMTMQVYMLPCLQVGYSAAWSLWLLRWNELLKDSVDKFCRHCAECPAVVDATYTQWFCIISLAGQIAEEGDTVYFVMCGSTMLSAVPPLVDIFVPAQEFPLAGTDWLLPQLTASIVTLFLVAHVIRSASAATAKCETAVAFVNSLQAFLPPDMRPDHGLFVSFMEVSDVGISVRGVKVTTALLFRLQSLAFSVMLFSAMRFQMLPEDQKAQLEEQLDRFLRRRDLLSGSGFGVPKLDWWAHIKPYARRGASVQRALREREAEVQRLEDKRLHDEEQWKAQILKLLGEVKKVEQTSASLSQELTATKSELSRVKAGGQDVVRRYEEESGRRLELEERCLQLEEKVRAGSAKSRDAEFQQKLKQSQQAKQTVEELAKHHEERGREEALRADEAEARCQDLQTEVQRLHALCCEQKQRIRELEASQAAPAAAAQEVPEEEGPPAASQLPPLPGRSSRPGTGGSAASAASERSRGPGSRSRSATESLPQPLAGGYQKAGASEGRLPPGAIRRGGSVPVRKPGAGRGIPHPLAKQSRSASPACQVQRTPPPFGAGILRVANSDSRPNSAASRQGSSQRAESEADLGIDDAIPSESDSSDEEEVLTAVKSSAWQVFHAFDCLRAKSAKEQSFARAVTVDKASGPEASGSLAAWQSGAYVAYACLEARKSGCIGRVIGKESEPVFRQKRGAFLDQASVARPPPAGFGDINMVEEIERQEDEVKHARLEVRLREMVLEVVAPTVERAVRMQNHCDHLSKRIESQHGVLTLMARDVHTAMEKLGLVGEFKKQLDDFWGSQKDLELKLANHVREVLANVEQCKHDCKTLSSTTERLNKQIIRAQEDTDHLRTDIFKMQTSLDMGVKKNKDHLDFEVKRLELGIDQVKDMHKALSNEIWGPEEVDEFSPPSLRRFDMQTAQLETTVGEVLAELQELRLLDSHVKKITGIQEGHGEHLTDLTSITTEISNRVEKVDKDLKAEIKRTANLMSAHSANMLHETRTSFSREVKELAALHSDVQIFLKDAEDSLQHVKESLDSSSRYVEASLHEVRLDIESLDSKRDRDKQALEDSMGSLQQQAESSSASLDQLFRSLEHLSSVLQLSLKGQRMVIALGVQDFVDRKDTTYVGFKKAHAGPLALVCFVGAVAAQSPSNASSAATSLRGCRDCHCQGVEGGPCRAKPWMVWVRASPCCDDFECTSSGFGGVCVRRQERCLPEHSTCGWSGQPSQSCCGSAQCQQLLGGSEMKCVEQQSCVATNEVCGGPGQLTQQCCGSAKCQQLLGGSQMTCVEQQSCVAVNEVCGGPGQLTQLCCGNAKCQQLFGGSQMICVEQESCVAENEVCGGPGQLTQPCCGDAKCRQLLGGSQMKCVKPQSLLLEQVCVAANEVCGGPGQMTQQCCGNARCQRLLGGSQMICVKQESCVAENEVCGGPGQLTQLCCGNAKCQQLFGGSQMICVEQESCVAENEVCGGPGQLTQPCCGNAKCQQLLGGSQMTCHAD